MLAGGTFGDDLSVGASSTGGIRRHIGQRCRAIDRGIHPLRPEPRTKVSGTLARVHRVILPGHPTPGRGHDGDADHGPKGSPEN